MENLAEIVQEVLRENRWGIYYKENPIESLKAQDGVMVIRVNKINKTELANALNKALEKAINK